MQYRIVGGLLLLGSLMFFGGAAASIPLVDAHGTSIYLLPPTEWLPVIVAQSQFWQWQALTQLGASVMATGGFALLTLTLWAVGNRVWPLFGLVAFVLSEALWLVIEAFRLGMGAWAIQDADAGALATAPQFYLFLFRWMEGALFPIALSLAFAALAAYGLAWLTTAGLRRWVGIATLAYACLGLGLVAIAGAALVPPEGVYLALGFLGVVLLWRRAASARQSLEKSGAAPLPA
jgi:hypothetical protein